MALRLAQKRRIQRQMRPFIVDEVFSAGLDNLIKLVDGVLRRHQLPTLKPWPAGKRSSLASVAAGEKSSTAGASSTHHRSS
ncbi:MAG: hypothetical protein ACRD20_02220 [Terriglobales bacterium]